MNYDNNNGRNGNQNAGKSERRYERDGVYYTPSSGSQYVQKRSQHPQEQRPRPPHPQEFSPQGRQSAAPRRGKSQKSQLSMFYIVALLICVSVCVAAVAILINSFSSGPKSADDPNAAAPTPTPPIVATDDPNAIYVNKVGVIKSAATDEGGVKIIDIDTDKQMSVTADDSTKMSDKYGRPLVLEEFTEGSVVDISYDQNTNLLKSIAMNSAAWERKLVKNIKIDALASTITVGNDIYKYDSNAIVRSKGETYDITRITNIDLINIKGYRDKAWYIELVSGHGIIEIVNKSAIKNGTIEVDTSIFNALEDVTELELLAGHHKVVVKGDNIELYVEDIEVIEGERQTLNLDKVRIKNGVLEITSNVGDFKAYVDGNEVSLLAPIPLEFGEYSLRVTKDGFNPYETKIIINSDVVSVRAELSRVVNLGTLIITAFPTGASVYIDDIKKGDAPCTISLEYGTYTLKVSAPGYADYTAPIDIYDKEHKYEIILIALDNLWLP